MKLETTIYGWSMELGVDRELIQRRIAKAGYGFEPNKKYTARQIFRAIRSDKEESLSRVAQAKAEKMELENRVFHQIYALLEFVGGALVFCAAMILHLLRS